MTMGMFTSTSNVYTWKQTCVHRSIHIPTHDQSSLSHLRPNHPPNWFICHCCFNSGHYNNPHRVGCLWYGLREIRINQFVSHYKVFDSFKYPPLSSLSPTRWSSVVMVSPLYNCPHPGRWSYYHSRSMVVILTVALVRLLGRIFQWLLQYNSGLWEGYGLIVFIALGWCTRV